MADSTYKPTAETAPVEKAKMDEANKKPTNGIAALYWREIERYDRAVADWYQEAEEIEAVYLDENRSQHGVRKFPLLWANVEVLKPAVYAKLPVVMCTRRYRDKDVVGRIAAELMERASNTTLDIYGADEVFRAVRDDRLIAGRGQGWVRYEAHVESYDDPDGTIDNDSGEVVQLERLANEKMCVDYVHWKDFGHNIARTWKEVWLVWRIVYKTEEEMAERFGADIAAGLSYTTKSPSFGSGSTNDDPENRCKVYEVHDRMRKQVAWLVHGRKDWLECGPPPINFRDFFPCPEPCYATKTSKELIPRPDYRYYRDLAKEINDLTEKIGNMSQWLIIKGFTPAAPSSVADPVEEALRDKANRELFQQVNSMADWTDRGGLAKIIDWFPTDVVVKAIQGAIAVRSELIRNVFEITGIGDILRGQTNPNETLGAQELKAQTGTRRLRNTKDEVARFCKDIAQLVAEGVAEKFEPENIAKITGFKYVPAPPTPMPIVNSAPRGPASGSNIIPMRPGLPAPMGHNMPPVEAALAEGSFDDEVLELLRDDQMRSFRIDIETDSTIQADEQAEKSQRMEFMNVMGTFLERAANIARIAPEFMPFMKDSLNYLIRSFRAGRSLEEALEAATSAAMKKQQQLAANPPPDPVVQVEQAKLQQKTQSEAAGRQLDAQEQQQNAQLEIRQQNINAQLEMRKQTLDASQRIRDTNVAANASVQGQQ